MSSAENRQQTSPDVPPSSSAGGIEMRDYHARQNAPQPPPNQAPYLTPYLGLRARLSQIAINRWSILLIVVLIRTMFAIASIDDGLDSARDKAMSACQGAESVGTALASTPYYISRGMNSMTASGIEKAVNGLMSMVNLMVTGIEEIVVFVIGMMTNTYLCLLTLIVRGSMGAAVAVLQKANDSLKKMTESLGDELGDASKGLQDDINDVASSVGSLFGNKLPNVDFTKQIDKLKDLSLPGDLTDDLAKLNSSIPTFDQVKNATESVIRLPFQELKKLISKEMGTYSFNGSILPLAAKETVSFCAGSDGVGINEVFDDLIRIVHVARTVFIVVLVLLALLVMAPMAWIEIKKWRRQQEHAKLLGDESMDNMDAVYIASRPTSSRVGLWLSRKFGSSRGRTLARWAVAYPTSAPALFVLSLALAGLFACFCQFILLKEIEKDAPAITKQVAAGAGKMVAALNNASNNWAVQTNKAVMTESDKINQNLLGWVNTSTSAVNETLNTFVDEVHDLADKFLGNTILKAPLEDLFRCLIGLKIEAFQKGLMWVHDNAHVNFPLVKNDTLSLAALADMTDSTSDDKLFSDPTGTVQRSIDSAVTSLIKKLMSGVRQEAYISLAILSVWVLMALIGAFRAWHVYLKGDKLRGEGGNDFGFSDPGRPTHDYVSNSGPPAYSVDSDVNDHAPYTLRHHAPPNVNRTAQSNSDENKDGFVRGPVGGNFSRPNAWQDQDAWTNEKANHDPFAEPIRI